MSQKIILALLLLLSIYTLPAQELVPYLCADGKYGISDAKGKIIVPCEFDEVEFNARDSFFRVKKEGKYGIIHYPSCKTILPPILETSYFYVSSIKCEEIIGDKTTRLSSLNSISYDDDYIFIFDVKDEVKTAFYAMKSNQYKTEKFKKDYLNAHTIKYKHDLWKFKQKNGLVNFYHKNGYILLKKDVINGVVISADRLLIEGENGKLALANLKGKTLTPHIYERIELTPNHQFIVNSKKGLYPEPEWAKKAKAGVLSKEGKLVIDTIYSEITPVHEKWYAVFKKKIENRRGYDNGILDAKGNTVLSVKYEQIKIASNGYVVAKKWDSDIYQIINLHSPKKAVLEGKDIQFLPTEKVYRIIAEDKSVTILDANLKEIYSGTFSGIRKGSEEGAYYINTGQNKYIFIKKGQKNKELEGIDNAYRNEYSGGYRYVSLVVADTLRGLLDENYNVVFEPVYAEIKKEKADQLYFLVKKNKDDLYEVHDSAGQKIDMLPIADPFFLRKDYPFKRTRINREEKLLFRDGSTRDVLDYTVRRPTKSANGKYLYTTKVGKRYYILNEELYNIIPEGYWVPEKYINEKQHKIGLICVYNDFNCGVIDAEGNWVIPASYNNYQIYDKQTIARYYSLVEGVELLIKKGEKWETTKYHSIRPVNKRNLFQVNKKKEETEKALLIGIIDSVGNVILPLQYDYVMVGQKYINAIIENKKDSTGISYILDESMNLLFETPHNARIEEKKGYITLYDFKTNKTGIVNFKNETIVPVKYNSLKYHPKSNHIQYTTGSRKDKTLKHHIAESSGKVIYTSKTFYPRFIDVGESTQLLLMVDSKMIIFDANNEMIGEYDLLFKQKTKGMHHFITCETKDTKQLVYLNMLTGKVMME